MNALKRNTTFEKRNPSCYEHWKGSGASGDIMDFYCSQYASNYCWQNRKYKPSKCNPCTNGFISNERPFLRYSRSLDSVDNPQIGDLCLENYCTVTRRDFPPYTSSSAWESLPRNFFRVPSSFTKNTVYEQPQGSCPLKSVTQESLEKGYLRRNLQASDPRRKPPTGITENYPLVDTLSGRSLHSFVDEYPDWMTDRPTGLSVTRTDYLPFKFEPNMNPKDFPKIIKNSGPDLNRTAEMVSDPAEILKEPLKPHYNKVSDDLKDPVEFWNKTEPSKKSVYSCSYKKRPIGETRREDQIKIGPKNKLLGSIKDCDLYIWKREEPNRFLTHYSTNFWERRQRLNDPPFPYLVNEFCRVDADFGK